MTLINKSLCVSVVIPVYNEEKYIGKCLDSLMKQTIPADEIIVVDNNCLDNTIVICKQFPVTVIKEKKQGMTFARNAGFNFAKSEIIARTDADCIPNSDWIKKIKNQFSNPSIQALSGNVIFNDIGIQSTFFSKIYRFFMRQFLKGNHVLMGPNMILRKSLWDKVKNDVCLNDKNVHEDIDLSYHITQLHETISYDPSLIMPVSGRRIKTNPYSFFIEYTIRAIKTITHH